MFGVTRTTKAQVSGVFSAVQLPNFLVSMLVFRGTDQSRIDASWLREHRLLLPLHLLS